MESIALILSIVSLVLVVSLAVVAFQALRNFKRDVSKLQGKVKEAKLNPEQLKQLKHSCQISSQNEVKKTWEQYQVTLARHIDQRVNDLVSRIIEQKAKNCLNGMQQTDEPTSTVQPTAQPTVQPTTAARIPITRYFPAPIVSSFLIEDGKEVPSDKMKFTITYEGDKGVFIFIPGILDALKNGYNSFQSIVVTEGCSWEQAKSYSVLEKGQVVKKGNCWEVTQPLKVRLS